jgi:hypothetical protein
MTTKEPKTTVIERTRFINRVVEDYQICQDAKSILVELVRDIKKRGGDRSRGEGIKLLNRVYSRLNKRIDDTFVEAEIIYKAGGFR